MSLISALRDRTRSVRHRKTWAVSQAYELRHAEVFMTTKHFQQLAAQVHRGEALISKGYVDDLMLREFFNNDLTEWRDFFDYISGKRCLEIGPNVFSPLATWDVAGKRYIIEPLLEPIAKWQKNKFGFTVFDGLNGYAVGAENTIHELVGRIDGAIYCRNCIDHSPMWPFILSNISNYAAPECRLLLWSDLDHRGKADDGHYDIVSDVPRFKNLVENLGFQIIREYQDQNRDELNWGCFAIRK